MVEVLPRDSMDLGRLFFIVVVNNAVEVVSLSVFVRKVDLVSKGLIEIQGKVDLSF